MVHKGPFCPAGQNFKNLEILDVSNLDQWPWLGLYSWLFVLDDCMDLGIIISKYAICSNGISILFA